MEAKGSYKLIELLESYFDDMDSLNPLDAVKYGAHLSKIMQEQSTAVLAYAKATKETRQLVRNAVNSQKKVIKTSL